MTRPKVILERVAFDIEGVKDSIIIDGTDNKLKLSGDQETPGVSKYYGTNGSGAKGWNALADSLPPSGPAGGVLGGNYPDPTFASGDLALGGKKITGVTAGAAGTDAVNKTQLDAVGSLVGTVNRIPIFSGTNTIVDSALRYDGANTYSLVGGVTGPTIRNFTLTGGNLNINSGNIVLSFDLTQSNSGITTLGSLRFDTTHTNFKIRIVSIGTWNMDTTATLPFTTISSWGITASDIRGVSVIIYDDAGNIRKPLSESGSYTVDSTAGTLTLSRTNAGIFDSTSYDVAGASGRGFITITYIA